MRFEVGTLGVRPPHLSTSFRTRLLAAGSGGATGINSVAMTIGEILTMAGVSGGVSAVLFALADFWKPFLASYLGKKGERLANAEDIEKILAEVRLVTAETETIKAQIAGSTWQRQTLLVKRIEVYGSFHGSIVRVATALSAVCGALLRAEETGDSAGAAEAGQRCQKAADKLADEQELLMANLCLARLFAGPSLTEAINQLSESMSLSEGDVLHNPRPFTQAWATMSDQILTEMRRELDLGQDGRGTDARQ